MLSMRLSLSLIFLVSALLSAGCAGGTAETKASAAESHKQAANPEAGDSNADGDAKDELSATTADSSPFIEARRNQVEPPEVSDACTFDLETGNIRILCEFELAILSAPIDSTSPENRKIAIAAMLQSWRRNGWALEATGEETMRVDGNAVRLERIHRTHQDIEDDTLLGVLLHPKRHTQRLLVCRVPSGASVEETDCQAHAEMMVKYARAVQVTSVRMQGEVVEVPPHCHLREQSVRCGRNLFSWVDYPASTSDGVFKGPKNALRANLEARGAAITDRQISCQVAGTEQPCFALKVTMPGGYRPMTTVVVFAEVDGRKVRMTCDVIDPPNAQKLPEPCSQFFDATFEDQ